MRLHRLQTVAADSPPGRTSRVGNRALIVIAALTAICSVALLVGLNGAYAPGAAPKGVVNTTRAIDVTEAAAYAATSADTIEIKNYAFAPADVTVPLGTTVTWVNEDTVPHTVTSKSGPAKFDSGQMSSGASWSATFATAGTYDYYCVDHPQMVAKITVAPGGTPPPTSSSAPPTTHPTTAPTTHPTSASTHPTTPSSPPVSTPGGSGTSTPPTTAPTSAPTSAPTGTPTSAPSTAQSSPPASTPSSSMSMPGGPTGGGQCGLNQIIGTLVQHVDSAHLGESPGQQVQDLTNLNQYVLSHTTLVANLLTPLLNGATGAADGALIPLLQHVNATHLGESPGQQVQDLMNLDQYVLTHTTLVANMLTPAEGLLTGAC